MPPGQEAALWRFTATLRDSWVEPRAIVLTTPGGDLARADLLAPDSPALQSPPLSLNIDSGTKE